MIRWMLTLFVTLALGLVPVSTRAQTAETDAPSGVIETVKSLADPQVTMQAVSIADGLVRSDEWAILHVRLKNRGDRLRGTLLTSGTGPNMETRTFMKPVDLEKGVTKDIQLLYQPPRSGQTIRILLDAGRRSVQVEVPIRRVAEDDVAIGVLGIDPVGVQSIKDTYHGIVPGRAPIPDLDEVNDDGEINSRSVKVGLIPTTTAPSRPEGYAIYNWLIWVDADPTQLTPDQFAALKAHIASGGNLFITVTDRWRQVASHPLADLLPVQLSGLRDGTGAARIAMLRRPRPTTPQAIAVAKSDPTRRIITKVMDDGDAIWVQGTFGLGTVHTLTVDPRIDPVRSAIRDGLWRDLLHLPAPGGRLTGVHLLSLTPSFLQVYGDTSNGEENHFSGHIHEAVRHPQQVILPYLTDIPGVAPIPLPWLGGLALVYLLVIGPLDYLILRAIKRPMWTWITFPVSILVFSAAALWGTSLIKGDQSVIKQVEHVDILPGTGLWRGQTWLSVWATRSSDIALTPGKPSGTSFAAAGGGYQKRLRVIDQPGAASTTWHADTWTLAYAMTSWTEPNPGKVEVYQREDGCFVVKNDTPLVLNDVHIRFMKPVSGARLCGSAYPLTLAAGAEGLLSPENQALDHPGYFDTDKDGADGTLITPAQDQFVEVGNTYYSVRTGRISNRTWDAIVLAALDAPIDTLEVGGLRPETNRVTILRAPVRFVKESN